jgi:L-alanine-DL-glutamate epimerase-like enolase superfamily enzyme
MELAWLEEPIAADSDLRDWPAVLVDDDPARRGRGLHGRLPFSDAALRDWGLGAMQPDLAEWGGFSGGLEVVRLCRRYRVRYCPALPGRRHRAALPCASAGGGGGDGLLEMDANVNPLRTEVLGGALRPAGGRIRLPGERRPRTGT